VQRPNLFTVLDVLAGASLAFAGGVWLTGWNMGLITNADALFYPALFQDIAVSGFGVLRTWHFASSSFLFPDVLLYAAIWFFAPHFGKSIPIYAGLIAVATVLAVWSVFRRGKRASYAMFSAAFVGGTTLVYAALSLLTSTHVLRKWWDSFVVPVHHFGNVINTLLGFAIYLWWREARASRMRLALLALSVGIGAFSDLLFTLTFVGPVLAVDFLLIWGQAGRSKWASLVLPGVFGAMCILASAVDAAFNPLSPLRGSSNKLDVLTSVSAFFAARLASPEERYGALLRVALLVGMAALVIRARSRGESRSALALFLMLTSIVTTVAGATVTGKYLDGSSDRYVLTFGFFPLFGILGYGAIRISEAAVARWMSVPALVVGCLATYLAVRANPVEAAKPPYVECIEKAGLTRTAGLAPYWLAKPLIVFSDRRIQAVQVTATGMAYGNVTNDRWVAEDWFGQAAAPPLRFALMASDAYQSQMLDGSIPFQETGKVLDPKSIRQLLGAPREVHRCDDGATLWLYSPEATAGRGPLPNGGLVRFPLNLRAEHGLLRRGIACASDGDGVRSNGEDGTVLFGPYIGVPAGEYRLRWFGRILAPSGTVIFDVAAGGKSIAEQPIALREVNAERTGLVVLDFTLREMARDLETRVFAHDGARLQLDELVIEQRR
jgi:hypothetical protein